MLIAFGTTPGEKIKPNGGIFTDSPVFFIGSSVKRMPERSMELKSPAERILPGFLENRMGGRGL